MDTSLLKLDLSLGDVGVRTRTLSSPRLASAIRRFRGFLHVMSKVRDMTVSTQMFEVLYQYSISEPLPQYGYMSSLHLTICVPQYPSLPTVLASFPNLKSLILVIICLALAMAACRDVYNKEDEICFSSVPDCLLSSLEFVDFKDPIKGYLAEMKLVKYFLKNSAILQELTLRLDSDSAKMQSSRSSSRSQEALPNVKSSYSDW